MQEAAMSLERHSEPGKARRRDVLDVALMQVPCSFAASPWRDDGEYAGNVQ